MKFTTMCLQKILAFKSTYILLLLAKTKDLAETKQRYNELKEQHQDKARQHQKLQVNSAELGDFLLLFFFLLDKVL